MAQRNLQMPGWQMLFICFKGQIIDAEKNKISKARWQGIVKEIKTAQQIPPWGESLYQSPTGDAQWHISKEQESILSPSCYALHESVW